VAFYMGEECPRFLRWWRGVLSMDWLGRAVSLHGGVLACAASEFWRDVGVQGRRDGRATRSVTSACEVFDGGLGGLTGKGARAAMPVECWSSVELACMNEKDRE
jgi:hypothetical protein